MTGPYSVHPWRSRREFLRSSAAVAAGAYGLSPSFALAALVPEFRRFGLQAQGTGAQR